MKQLTSNGFAYFGPLALKENGEFDIGGVGNHDEVCYAVVTGNRLVYVDAAPKDLRRSLRDLLKTTTGRKVTVELAKGEDVHVYVCTEYARASPEHGTRTVPGSLAVHTIAERFNPLWRK